VLSDVSSPLEVCVSKRNTESVDLLISGFKTFLAAYDRACPFNRQGQLQYHVETIGLRRRLGSAKAALADEPFQRSLYRTLQAWGIGARASRLRDFPDFVGALQAEARTIEGLDGLAIDDTALDVRDVGSTVARLAQSLDIVTNKTRIVPGSKTLHHLLPDLVVPIDREYTQRFFDWANPSFQQFPERCFRQAFSAFATIARQVNPEQHIGAGWYTSRTKVIDNAIVGLWCWVKEKVRATT
jgi:hypothetical protein